MDHFWYLWFHRTEKKDLEKIDATPCVTWHCGDWSLSRCDLNQLWSKPCAHHHGHHQRRKISSMVFKWIYDIFARKIVIIEEHNEHYMMILFLPMEVDLLALTSMCENQFLSLLRSKPPFQPEMLRPKLATTNALF